MAAVLGGGSRWLGDPEPRGGSGSHPPLEPVKSSSSVASTQSTGLVWPSATETHCSGAVLAPLAPPTGVMTPLPGREGERRPSARGRGQAERGAGHTQGLCPWGPRATKARPEVRPLRHHPERFQAARPARHSRGSEQTGPACGGSPLTLLTQNPRRRRPQAGAGWERPQSWGAPLPPRRPRGGVQMGWGAQAARPLPRWMRVQVHTRP